MKRAFQLANEQYRLGNYLDAFLIYDGLAIKSPFMVYSEARDRCFEKLSKTIGYLPNINTLKHTVDSRIFRYFDTLARLKFTDEDLLDTIKKEFKNNPDHLLLLANAANKIDKVLSVSFLNQWINLYGLRGFETSDDFYENFLSSIRFSIGNIKSANQKISVFMSSFNSEKTIEYAIKSVLNQDYENIELIIIDDCSIDQSRKIILKYAKKDERIIYVFNDKNMGTYANRNIGLSISTGHYFTVLDSDDLCHPQRLVMQKDILDQRPNLIAVIGHWLRLDTEGRVIFRNAWGGVYLHEAVATLMFYKDKVVQRIGYYDSVRFAADTEYLERIRKVFGNGNVANLKLPITFALAHENSLTADKKTGINNFLGISPIRLEYRKNWNNWHTQTSLPFMEIKPKERMFKAPPEMI